MLHRYLIPIFALCVISQLGAANKPQIMKSNAVLNAGIRVSADVHSRNKRSTQFSPEEIQAIVDTHNDFRRNVSPGPASNMEHMEWNDDLATMAQQWSDMCRFEHGNPDNISPFDHIGQNLYASSNAGSTGVDATTSWNNEDVYYDYEYDTCRAECGHYTQNVWATSNSIGCGYRFCEPPVAGLSWSTANIITCNYGPAGNYNRRPYLLGPPCTECDSGVAECYDGLCQLQHAG